jgi:hypothetical protein
VAIKNGKPIETDNCITTIIYILSFTATIFMYQAQLINTEILSDKIKRNNLYNWTHIYVFSGRRNEYTNTNAVFILTVTIPHWRFMINISVFINWVWYINIVTVNERIYIMVVMQLTVSIDCPFLIATFSSVYINLIHD